MGRGLAVEEGARLGRGGSHGSPAPAIWTTLLGLGYYSRGLR